MAQGGKGREVSYKFGRGHILLGGNIPGFPPPPDKTLHGLAKLSIILVT